MERNVQLIWKSPARKRSRVIQDTAILAGCTKLHSGDPDFENIKEMNTEII